MTTSILVNEHGTWRIERIVSERGYRWKLYHFRYNLEWVLVANQGRRKTCVELANAGYQVKEIDK